MAFVGDGVYSILSGGFCASRGLCKACPSQVRRGAGRNGEIFYVHDLAPSFRTEDPAIWSSECVHAGVWRPNMFTSCINTYNAIGSTEPSGFGRATPAATVSYAKLVQTTSDQAPLVREEQVRRASGDMYGWVGQLSNGPLKGLAVPFPASA